MSEPQTIREVFEEIASYWESCPAVVMQLAGTGIDLLDNATKQYNADAHGEPGMHYLGFRLVPDPAPRGDAE